MPETAPGTAQGRTTRLPRPLAWLLAPATDQVPRSHALAATALRVLLGLLWLYNVAWKRPPAFGESDDPSGVYGFTRLAVEHPVFPPFSWVVEHLVLPVFPLFGWGVLILETLLAVLLLSGTLVRVAAALGIAQSLAIGLSVAYAPGEWPWAYWLMIGAHLVVLFSAAGRHLGVEAVRAGLTRPGGLTRVWGVLAVGGGVVAGTASLGEPLAARGFELGSSDPSISLGEYNLLGALVLLAVGVLLLLTPLIASAGYAAVAVATLGALSLHAQIGFSDPVLGGDATSAAFLLTLAAVALGVAGAAARAAPHR